MNPQTRRPARLDLCRISQSFGSVRALRDLSLAVPPGELLTLLGASGSGKSTALMAIAGFQPIDAGQVLIDGRDVTAIPPYKRDIGIVFQHYALFPHMTVAGNVGFPLRMRRAKARLIADRVAAALDLVRLGGFDRRMPHELSGGQQQRVALARALVFEPSLLLLDEPLSALDRKLREEMQVEIRGIQQKLQITTIAVTHDQQEALTMSDRVAILRDGQVEQIGVPADIYERPAKPFVADFMGATNILPGPQHGLKTVVRPERIMLHGEPSVGLLVGQVVTCTYVGAAWRTQLRLPDGTELVAAEPGGQRHAAGSVVGLSWKPDHAWTMPGETTAELGSLA